ncbi:MAG: DUF1905 domain-containing protein [Thaumarchaeota archaeon]|nr:DUF1905 domain-containing protein [Nitrososphaerota archaeon]
MAQEFSAKIHKFGINPCIDVPKRISEVFGRRGYIPVLATIKGLAFRATLVPVGGGQHRLYINGDMRRKAGVGVGDRIDVKLELDMEPRVTPMPMEFALALQRNSDAKAAFEKLLPSRQKDILTYLCYLKRPESLKRNIEKIIAKLVGQPR